MSRSQFAPAKNRFIVVISYDSMPAALHLLLKSVNVECGRSRVKQHHLAGGREAQPVSRRFLQTNPLPESPVKIALASRILLPMNGVSSVINTDWVCQLRWANKKRSSDEERL